MRCQYKLSRLLIPLAIQRTVLRGRTFTTLWSAENIYDTPPCELGRGNFCFLVAEILLERFPDARLCRLASPGHDYAHILILVDDEYIDIKGRTTLAEMRFYFDDNFLKPMPVDDEKSVRDFFYSRHEATEL